MGRVEFLLSSALLFSGPNVTILPMRNLILLLAVIALPAQAQTLVDRDRALHHMLDNISPLGTLPGTVIASPQRAAPDYYFHWIRDAALVMQQLVDEYERAPSPSREKLKYRHMLEDFAFLSLDNQGRPSAEGLGEPKFNVDGSVFTGDWSRPQNDGPALRALTFIRWANILLREGQEDYVRVLLLNGDPKSLIQTDLNYVAERWNLPCYDLWEETLGTHFYTRVAQAEALALGAKLARSLGYEELASRYETVSALVETELGRFWDPARGYIETTVDWKGGVNFKHMDLDSSVVLAALHARGMGSAFALDDPRVMATMARIRDVFRNKYPINKNGLNGVHIGRYPEDLYAGHDFSGGNAWPMLTAAFAEAYYRLGELYAQRGSIKITPELRNLLDMDLPEGGTVFSGDKNFSRILLRLFELGDFGMARIKEFAGEEELLPEQYHRDTGAFTSARDLTWSYAGVIAAYRARDDFRRLFAK
jgi:glucoamylase